MNSSHNSRQRSIRRSTRLIAAVAVLSTSQLYAASGTWTGGANDGGLWQTPGNWVGGTVPGSNSGAGGSNTDVVTIDSSSLASPIISDSNRNISGITFDNLPSPFQTPPNSFEIRAGLTGTDYPLYVTSGGTIQATANFNPTAAGTGVADAAVVVKAPLQVVGAGTYTFTANHGIEGVFRIEGAITGAPSASTTLRLNGAHGDGANNAGAELWGAITDGVGGTVGIVKEGIGTWELSASTTSPNTYSGNTVINSGLLSIENTSVPGGASTDGLGALSVNSNYIVNPGGKLRLDVGNPGTGPYTIGTAKSITINSNTTAVGINNVGVDATQSANTTINLKNETGPALHLNFGDLGNNGASEMPNVYRVPTVFTGTTANQGGIKLTNNSSTDRFALGSTTTPMDLGSVVRPIEITARGSNSNYDLRTRGPLAGSGGILKLGPGMLRIDFPGSGSHTFTGSLEVREGILRLGTSGSIWPNILPNSPLLVSGGTLDVVDNGSNIQSFPSVTVTKGFLKGGSGAQSASTGSIVRSTSFTFNVALGDTATSDVSLQDSISAADLVKNGAGLAMLAGENFYTGATTINAGTLQIGNGGTRGSLGAGAVINNAALVFNRHAASSTTVSNAISGTGSVTMAAGENLTLSGALSYSGATTANAGKLILTGSQTNTSALNASGGTIQLAGASGIVVKAPTVTVGGGGMIDITDEKIIVPGGTLGTATGGTYTPGSITGLVQVGRNGGAWNGNGIITSKTAAAGSTALTTVGVAQASAVGYGGTRTFAGQSVNATDILVMYTYAGDATLSGAIDGDDFAAIDIGYSSNLKGYSNGDFNYSGKVDADDYWIINANYVRQGTAFSTSSVVAGVTAVPEPTAAALLLLGAGFLRRRRAHLA